MNLSFSSDSQCTLTIQGFSGVVPDVISFNVGIAAFMANSMDKNAFELLDEMERRGIRPRADTFNSILTGMTKVGSPFSLIRLRIGRRQL